MNSNPDKYSLISVDARAKEAEKYFMENNDIKITMDKHSITIDENMLFYGQKTGENTNINQAVNKQKDIYLLN